MKLSLENRVVMITGPAKGMGASITHAFAEQGCKLALLGRDISALEPVAAEVKAKGDRHCGQRYRGWGDDGQDEGGLPQERHP